MEIIKKIGIVTAFAISMAFIESAVVVYLREIYYPEGFDFPIKPMSSKIGLVEVMREIYTIILLLAAAFLAGRTRITRFAYFIFCFAIWDIFYYVFLKFILGWPDSFLTWDILFLIPTTWTGPVISPIIVSLTMILLSLLIFLFQLRNSSVHFSSVEIILMISGAIIIFISFIWDYSHFIFKYYTFSEVFHNLTNPELSQVVLDYIPEKFNWFYFWIGELIALVGIGLFFVRNISNK